ncbi:MAG: tripartite tricarboxylate transporter substrate binding protein [Burkholderiales bacterium]|jgi:tripartite-type tricarboxylate transporter receptor subunit TctC
MMKRLYKLLGVLILAGTCAQASAQTYPAKPIRLVVGFAPGGAADFVARAISEPLSKALGQPIVVENRAGAGSSIAADYVAKSAPDGYTMLIASPSSISVNPTLNSKLGYSLRDFAPITKVSNSPLLITAYPGLGVNSIKELIAVAKKSPGKLNYSSSGNGSAPHLAGVLFGQLAGIDIVHVPFKGGAPSVQSVLAGDTQLTFATPPSVLPLVHSGRLRALAVTSRKSTPLVPGVPGMEEAGLPDYEISFWYGFFVPAATKPEIVKKLYDATITALQQAQVKQAFAREGTEVATSSSPADFAAFLAENNKLWVHLVKESGATLD